VRLGPFSFCDEIAERYAVTPLVGPTWALDVGRPPVKLLRRALMALSLASLIAGSLRLRGKGGVPPQEGGWKELRVPRS
jgi:hypothetical protein